MPNTSPLGTEPLWGFTSLPKFYRGLAREIARQRGDNPKALTQEQKSRHIASAIRTSKRWETGQSKISMGLRLQAAAANGEWAAKKAEAARRRAVRGG